MSSSEGRKDQLEKPKNKIPCVEGLFSLPTSSSSTGHLVGSKCRSCGKLFFPKMSVCLNCSKVDDMEEIALSNKGKLYCYTVVYQKVPGSLVDPPFVAAIVELTEGIQVRTILTDVKPETLDMDSIGREVEMVFEKIKEDEGENDVMAFKFKFV